MKRWRFLAPLALFVVLLGFLAAGLNLNPRELPSPLIGNPALALALALARLDEPTQTIRREDLLGRAWMLNIWASWCAACRDEHPLLVEFSRHRVVPIYGLSHKDGHAEAQLWLARLGSPYAASLSDTSGRVGIDFGVYGSPDTFVIDEAGVIRFNLETAVGRARVGRCGRVWVGATTQQATTCKAEQRPQTWLRRLNRVRSAVTQKVNAVVAQKVSVHAALPADAGGQLRFLGSSTSGRSRRRCCANTSSRC